MCFANSSQQEAMLANIHDNGLPQAGMNAWWVDAGWWKNMQKPSGWWPDNAHGCAPLLVLALLSRLGLFAAAFTDVELFCVQTSTAAWVIGSQILISIRTG